MKYNPNFYLVIPARNEATSIASVLQNAKKMVPGNRIIVIDDGSNDQTFSEAMAQGVIVLRHIINLGKGAALKTGCRYAYQKGAEGFIFMDSDGQHNPKDIPRILQSLEGNDIVFTYRNRKSVHMPLIKKFGNFSIDLLMKLLFQIKVQDSQCGYKAITRQAYEKLALISNDYSIESEIAAKTGKYRLRFAQIPIETVYADRYKGTTVFDGINIVMKMLWWRIAR